MIQQVNLYQDILKQGKRKPAISVLWIGPSIIILSLIVYSLYLIWDLNNLETQLQLHRQKLTDEQTQVAFISSTIPKQEIDKQLVEQIAHQQTILGELTHAVQQLSGKKTDQKPGFSNYFIALSNQSIPDVWLSTIYIALQPEIINIAGSTFKPEKIPFFFQQLQKEPIFEGHSFAKLVMQQSETIPKQIDFKLSTTLEDSHLPDRHAQ